MEIPGKIQADSSSNKVDKRKREQYLGSQQAHDVEMTLV